MNAGLKRGERNVRLGNGLLLPVNVTLSTEVGKAAVAPSLADLEAGLVGQGGAVALLTPGGRLSTMAGRVSGQPVLILTGTVGERAVSGTVEVKLAADAGFGTAACNTGPISFSAALQ